MTWQTRRASFIYCLCWRNQKWERKCATVRGAFLPPPTPRRNDKDNDNDDDDDGASEVVLAPPPAAAVAGGADGILRRRFWRGSGRGDGDDDDDDAGGTDGTDGGLSLQISRKDAPSGRLQAGDLRLLLLLHAGKPGGAWLRNTDTWING